MSDLRVLVTPVSVSASSFAFVFPYATSRHPRDNPVALLQPCRSTKRRPYFGNLNVLPDAIRGFGFFGCRVRFEDLDGAGLDGKREAIRRFKWEPGSCIHPPILPIQAPLHQGICWQVTIRSYIERDSPAFPAYASKCGRAGWGGAGCQERPGRCVSPQLCCRAQPSSGN